MDNPLTNQQIEELNNIIKLPREEQASKLQAFLKTLNKEQIEFLKQHQTQQCLFCGIVLGSISSYKIYEDDEFLAVLDINPANLGHVIIISKIHVKNIYEVNSKIFDLANLIAKKMKEKLDADSNIFVANGENAGQKVEHVIVHIIPRYKDDNINLTWQTRKVSQDKLNEILLILKIQEEKKETKKEKII
ncbi:MAG: HIT family protein, partial [Nanoarchaeota archaeon]